MWPIHTEEYCPTTERTEGLTHAATRMYPENSTLSEGSPSQGLHSVWFRAREVSRAASSPEAETRQMPGCQWGAGSDQDGFGVSLWGDGNVLELESGDGCSTLNALKATELYCTLLKRPTL